MIKPSWQGNAPRRVAVGTITADERGMLTIERDGGGRDFIRAGDSDVRRIGARVEIFYTSFGPGCWFTAKEVRRED